MEEVPAEAWLWPWRAPGKAPAAAGEAAWQARQELALVWRPRFRAKWKSEKSAGSTKGLGEEER